MRKLLSILLTLALIIGIFPPVAKADESLRQSLNQHVDTNYGFENFFPQTVNGKPFNIVKVDTITDNSGKPAYTFELGYELKMPNYGEPWSFTQKFGVYRYAGYTPQGLPNGMPNHPFDDWGGGILETRQWMDDPWTDEGVKTKIASDLGVSKSQIKDMFPEELSLAIRDIPQIREKILWGLILNPYNGEFIVGKGPGQGINYPWEEKIMVYYPPTEETWGRGRMWHCSKQNGKLYYFNIWIPNTLPGSPDFYPTPEGSTEWQPTYKDPKYCAKTYTYEQGQKEITFPVNLFNQGEEAITDFKAVWFNSSKVSPKPWDSPVWQNDNEISIAKGESKTFEVTVPLPVPDYAGGMLAFKCNVDSKTPANEVNQENNMMIIKIQEAGVDVVTLMPDELIYLVNPGEVADVFVPLTIIREDTSPKPVDVDIKYSGPFGSVNKQATLAGFYSIGNDAYYEMHFKLSKPGTYKVYAEAWPISITDINPANNKAETRIIVKLKKQYDAEKINPDDQTRVNLRS